MSPCKWIALSLVLLPQWAAAAPIVSGKYYEDFATAQCLNVSTCRLVFSAIPNGTSVLLERVSCAVTLTGFNTAVRAVLQVKDASSLLVPRREEEILLTSVANGSTTYVSANGELQTKLGQKLVPLITLTYSNALNSAPHCRLVGETPSPL